MLLRSFGALTGTMLLMLAACGPAQEEAATPGPQAGGTQPAQQLATVRCEPSPRMPVEGRASPYDSTTIAIGGTEAKVCYGRPSARGRTMIGGEHVPYGQLWRTGANEPTIIHLPFPASIAGIAVERGSYSLYTIPAERDWTVIVNRSTAQWGHEASYTEAVRAQEVGRATVRGERTDSHVETFTIRSEPVAQNRANMVLEWENTRVRIPVERQR